MIIFSDLGWASTSFDLGKESIDNGESRIMDIGLGEAEQQLDQEPSPGFDTHSKLPFCLMKRILSMVMAA
jgi:hypothetical protein